MAEIYDKSGDSTLILGVREIFYQPFEATGWTDLRLGWFLSLTDATGDDTITGLAETVDNQPWPWSDFCAIGLTDRTSGTTFIGYTNATRLNGWEGRGESRLVASDDDDETGTEYWRTENVDSKNLQLQFIDAGNSRAWSQSGSAFHFAQANIGTTGPAGYATLLMLRLTRPNATTQSKIITMSVKTGYPTGQSSDVLFTDTPDVTTLEDNLEAFPETVQTIGPVEMSRAPDTFFVYWPFHQSRLRIHAHGLCKQV